MKNNVLNGANPNNKIVNGQFPENIKNNKIIRVKKAEIFQKMESKKNNAKCKELIKRIINKMELKIIKIYLKKWKNY